MTKYEVLNQLNKNELKAKEAYRLLYNTQDEPKARKASFIKVRIRVPESKGATVFLSILLFLPIPLFLVKMFVPRKIKNSTDAISDQLPLTTKQMLELIAVKGVKIDIHTHDDVKVYIKTI